MTIVGYLDNRYHLEDLSFHNLQSYCYKDECLDKLLNHLDNYTFHV